MRLPFPFGRRSPAPEADPKPPAPPPEPTPAAPVPAVEPPQRASHEWSSLPPIQRTVAEAPLTAPARPFTNGTAGHRGLPPILRPLAHEVSPVAPAGLVVARTVDGPGVSPRPLPAPAAPGGVRRPTPTVGDPAPDPFAGLDTSAWFAAPSFAAMDDPAPAAPAPAQPAPTRSLEVVSPAAAARPPERPLTSVAAAPLVPVARSATSVPARSPAPVAPAAPPMAGGLGAGFLPFGPSRTSQVAPQAPRPTVQRAASDGGAGGRDGGSARRLGFGDPLRSLPPSARPLDAQKLDSGVVPPPLVSSGPTRRTAPVPLASPSGIEPTVARVAATEPARPEMPLAKNVQREAESGAPMVTAETTSPLPAAPEAAPVATPPAPPPGLPVLPVVAPRDAAPAKPAAATPAGAPDMPLARPAVQRTSEAPGALSDVTTSRQDRPAVEPAPTTTEVPTVGFRPLRTTVDVPELPAPIDETPTPPSIPFQIPGLPGAPGGAPTSPFANLPGGPAVSRLLESAGMSSGPTGPSLRPTQSQPPAGWPAGATSSPSRSPLPSSANPNRGSLPVVSDGPPAALGGPAPVGTAAQRSTIDALPPIAPRVAPVSPTHARHAEPSSLGATSSPSELPTLQAFPIRTLQAAGGGDGPPVAPFGVPSSGPSAPILATPGAARPLVQRTPADLPLNQPAAPPPAPQAAPVAQTPTPPPAAPPVQRSPEPAPVQRAPDPPPAPVAVQRAADAPTGATTVSAPAAPGAPGGHSERDLDDLARKLYPRMRLRIRDDLIIDREAHGLSLELT